MELVMYICCMYRQFIKEELPPIQYKNPMVQVVLFKNSGKPPFVNIYLGESLAVVSAIE